MHDLSLVPQRLHCITYVLCRHWQGWLGFSQHPAATAHTYQAGDDSSSSSSSNAACDGTTVSGRLLLSSPEVLDLGVCLPACTAKQLLTLTNTAPVPLEFAWQLGVFEEQQGIMSGRLAIVPTSGETHHIVLPTAATGS